MIQKANKSAFTILELVVSIVIVTLLMAYVWKIYFNGRETMRNTVSQSQMQSDTRLFLDHFDNQMSSCYSFYEVDPEQHKFGFYSFVYSRTPLDEILYDHSGKLKKTDETSTQKIKVAKYEYIWDPNTGKVIENRVPGWLYFLQKPMKFEEGDPQYYLGSYHKMENKVVLRNIAEFEFAGYNQIPDSKKPSGFRIEPTTKVNPTNTVFIALRIHTKKEEGKTKRDEELDIVNKFYCKTRLSAVTHNGFFSTTDQDGKY